MRDFGTRILAPSVADEELPVACHARRVAARRPQATRAAELFLQALGYSYAELQTLIGSSYSAINRRLIEGRAAPGADRRNRSRHASERHP